MPTSFAGAGTALVTPFRADGSLDETAFRRLVRRQIEGAIDVLVPCGTTGESVTMTAAEQERVIAWTVEEAGGRKPVLAGTGSNDTESVVARSRRAQELGASGVLVVGPYYNKPTAEGYYRHFAKVAEALTIPVVVYNVPGRTGGNIDARTQLRLAGHGNVKAVKEASGNVAQVEEILAGRPAGFEVLSGDDALTLPLMALGADGVVSVISNQLPREMHELAAACRKGDFAAARAIHYRLLELMHFNFLESNPIPVKTSLALMGLCEESFRLPMCPPTDATREKLRGALRRLGLVA
jgi:4-hydroxy-tetrahydrodipicolinate synthase